jgi:2Fe-2S ferredoxin
MAPIIFSNDQHTVHVPCVEGLNLLGHAQLEEIQTGSRCGGYGECGADRLQLTQGAEYLTPLTDAEREHLSVLEIDQGFRLGCQAFLIKNLDMNTIVVRVSTPKSEA